MFDKFAYDDKTRLMSFISVRTRATFLSWSSDDTQALNARIQTPIVTKFATKTNI